MKNALLLACFLASGPTLLGQTAASSIEGQVVNAATGVPVGRATVWIERWRSLPRGPNQPAPVSGPDIVEADAQGRFAFRDVPPGGYKITVQRQGFIDPSQGQIIRPMALLMVGENQHVTGVVVRLTPHSVISGKVLDADGEPLAGVHVDALRWGYENGKRELTRAATSSMEGTNELGEYRLAGLRAGSYFVMAEGPRFFPNRRWQETPELAYTNTYYAAATDPAAATPVRAPAGSEVRGIDIKLIRTKTVTIRGRVIDPGAAPNRTAMVSLMPRLGAGGFGFPPVGPVVTLAGGTFQMSGVPPGSYTLVARRNSNQGAIAAGGSLGIEVGDKSLDGITLQVSPVMDVEGVVNSEPAGRCGGDYFSLVDASGLRSSPSANTSGDSKFTLKNVVPSTYTLNLPAMGACYLKSVRFAGRDLPDMQVSVDGSGPLEITLMVAEAVVEGTVADSAGKPVENATVSFIPKDGAPSSFRTASTNRTGVFLAPGMRPGAYDVFAWERVDYYAVQSPEYLKPFANRAESITVAAAGRQAVQLTAIPASATGESAPPLALPAAKGSLGGQVVNALTGAPLSGVKVTLGTQPVSRPQAAMPGAAARVPRSPGGQAPPPGVTVETDAQGRFAIRDIEPDIYFIAAERQGFSSADSTASQNMTGDPIVVGNGQRITGYTLKLAPQSVIVGKVTDEFGEAVVNAQAMLYVAEYVRGSRRLARRGIAQTDDLGKFRLSGMAPGSYYLAVMKRAQARQPRLAAQAPANEPEMGYGMIWYPNALDAAGASPIVVGATAEVPIEVVLRRTRVVRIQGTMVDSTGAPIQRASVELTPRGLTTITSIGSLRMMPGGAFEITNVPAGSYILSARAMNNGTATENGTLPQMAFLPVEVRDANLDDIKLELTTAREVRGAVWFEGGAARSAILTASAVEGLSTSASASPMNGAFTLRSVWPLTYSVDVRRLCLDCYVKSVRYGGRDVPETGIEFSGDGVLEIVVSALLGSLDGVAVDRQGRPAGGAAVILETADGTRRILSGKADARGVFHFDRLRPGAYRVYAWEGAAPDASPEALAPFQAQATTVRLEENAKEKVRIATIKH